MKRKKVLVLIIIFIIIIGLMILGLYFKKEHENKLKLQKEEEIRLEKEQIKNNYNTFVKAKDNINIYNSEFKKIGTISKDTYIILDDEYEVIDKYYKFKNLDYYILYSDIEKTEEEIKNNDEYKTYKNYIPFNENIITNDIYKVYYKDDTYIELNESKTYPIIIKDENRYGVDFNERLVYINKEDIKEIVNIQNTDSKISSGVAVLNYHFTIDATSDERKECVQSICIAETKVDEQIKYLKENNFYSTSMRDLYLFLTGKIQLPEKSVSITIDDGWYVSRMISILERHEMLGTLFLIGSLASPEAYNSKYLEIHSHTWDMHTPGVCSGGYGGGILCLDENKVLEDLKKSKESLSNTTVFCYPFYENNKRSKELLIKAGFEMAFVGGNVKATPGVDLYKIPRYVMYDSTTLNQFINFVN